MRGKEGMYVASRPGPRLTEFLHQFHVVQNSDAMHTADLVDQAMLESPIARTKHVGMANYGGLQNRIIVRVAHDGWEKVRDLHAESRILEKCDIFGDGLFRKRPAGLDMRVAQHALHFGQ